MNLIRGVLLAGKFRTQHQLNTVSPDDQRNILIVVLGSLSTESGAHYQAMADATLAGVGAVLVFLREGKIRSDAALKTMSDDDKRNILIVEIGGQTGMGRELQGMSNMELVLIGLGKNPRPGQSLSAGQGSFIRGVLLAGNFRTQHELDRMSPDDQRNTLITELGARSNETGPHLQSMNDAELAGAGAALVFLRSGGIRDDATIKRLSADDQRNIAIVEVGSQTNLGSRLQGLSTMDVVLTALGVDPVFPVVPTPRYVFSVDSLVAKRQKADGDHSDSDWLSIVVTVGDPVTKQVRTLPTKTHHLEGAIKTGDVIAGNFATDMFEAADSEVVVITYVIVNLGSSDAEEQFQQAVQVTNTVVQIVAPIVGTAVGLFFGAAGEGLQIGEKIASTFSAAISTLSDVFDFLGIHVGPPNCNGEVLHDALTFAPGELARAAGHPASRDYTGPQTEERCGGAPESTVNFSVVRVPASGLFPSPVFADGAAGVSF